MSVKKGLGRGFASLIPTELLDESFDPTAAQDEQISELRHIKLSEIVADPEQPRRHFDEVALDEMAASIKEHGILQPIVVTPYQGSYQIVAGERRYRASQLAGLDKIPALVRTLSGQHKLELSLIENLQRRDLNVLETATAYLKLRDQFNLTLDQIGERVGGKSVSAISNTLRLLRLPEVVRQAIADGKLREGQARPLIGLDETIILEVLPQILKEEWSARKIEQFIVTLKKGQQQASDKPPAEQVTRSLREKETKQLARRFATDVKIRTNTRGAGQIVIAFKSEEEFSRIQKMLDA
ncbi:chromosome partitioning protein ParB [Candidatus Saccharibacteria bacterium RIFCSPHIGHO2_01_FULL_46_30]|nr:MAG: chromosome partitioning protein ParB [Candidatus Saccharibacteria bacterium RIFCSPHIGHO2_01_FULL_46_30]